VSAHPPLLIAYDVQIEGLSKHREKHGDVQRYGSPPPHPPPRQQRLLFRFENRREGEDHRVRDNGVSAISAAGEQVGLDVTDVQGRMTSEWINIWRHAQPIHRVG